MANTLVRTSLAALTAVTISTAALTMTSAPAAAAQTQAQNHIQLIAGKPYGYRNKRLYPQQVVRILKRYGYTNVRRVYYNNGKYYARANGRYGPVKLTVGARSGRILARQRLTLKPRYPHHRHYYGRSHNGFSWSFTFGH